MQFSLEAVRSSAAAEQEVPSQHWDFFPHCFFLSFPLFPFSPFPFPPLPLKKQFKFQFSAYRLQFSIGYIHLGIKISDLESLPVNLQFHFQPISCFTSDPFVQPGLCFSQVPLCSRPLASLTAHLPSYSASGAETGKKNASDSKWFSSDGSFLSLSPTR